MSITKPVFVRFDNIQRPHWAAPVAVGAHNGVRWALNSGARWAFPQPPARRKKSDLPKIKRRLKP